MMMDKAAIDQAQAALKNFRALQPTLTQYARMLTGRADVRVVASATSNGSTDGKSIYYRPPISLGKSIQHERWNCDRRDELGVLKCPACSQREDVLSTIYHEIAHIWFNSFSGLTERAKEKALVEAVAATGTVYAEKIKARIDAMPADSGYMALARIVSPYLPLLLNALEDARVNEELFRALPGTKIMFDSNTACIFRDGVETTEDGKWVKKLWCDQPLNNQALIAVFCIASGYSIKDWLAPFVVTMLSDDTLTRLIRKIDDAGSVDAVFTQSFPILDRLRELGFCRDDEDPEDDYEPLFDEPSDDPSDDDEKEDTDESDDDGAAGGPDDGTGEPSESEDSGSGDDPASDDGHEDGDSDGDGEPGDSGTPGEEGGVDEEDSDEHSSEERSAGPETDGDVPDGDASGRGAGSDVPNEGAEEAGEGVPEEDLGDDEGEPGPDPSSVDSDDLRDGDPSGDDGVDGSDDSDRRDEGTNESSGDADADDDGSRRESDDAPSDKSRPHDGDSLLDETDPDATESTEPADGGDLGDDSGEDAVPIDTTGPKRGIRVNGELVRPVRPSIDWGTAEGIEVTVHEFGGHDPSEVEAHMHDDGDMHFHGDEDAEGDHVVKAVLATSVYFEEPSAQITEVKMHTQANGGFMISSRLRGYDKREVGIDGDFDPPPSLINTVTSRARIVFAENRRGRHETGLRRGRIHSPSLAMKAPVGDDTFFRQKRIPGRVDYFVGIGIDISGSTMGLAIMLAKQVAMAEAEMLASLGIPFFVYAHSGMVGRTKGGGYPLNLWEVKSPEQIWDDAARDRLRALAPQSANLDGHTIQVYRKILENQRATKKILHYYSDGAMPCENYREELDILTEEIQVYRQRGIILAGVGIKDDAPRQHGLETVVVNSQDDIMLVIEDLEKRLTRR